MRVSERPRGGASCFVCVRQYATFAHLAGLPYPTDDAAAAAGLPPLDSANAWPALTRSAQARAAATVEEEELLTAAGRSEAVVVAAGAGGTAVATIPAFTHAEIPLSSDALLDARTQLKFLRGKQHPAGWQGRTYPNASSPAHAPSNATLACGTGGCLFNVSSDPTEQIDLAPVMPHVASAMRARLETLSKSFFDNRDVGVDACPPGVLPTGVPCACWMALHRHGGVMGPFQV